MPKFPTRQEVRLLGGAGEVLRFLHVSNPAVAWKRSLDGAVIGASRRLVEAIEPLGLQLPLFDITTGTGDFVADGMVRTTASPGTPTPTWTSTPAATSTPRWS